MSLIEKAKLVDDLYVRLTGELKSCREQLTSTRYQLEQAIQAHNQKLKDIEMNAKGIEVMKDLIGELSARGLAKLQDLLSYGMLTIFDDRRYSIEIEISDRGENKTAIIWLVENINGIPRKTRIKDSVGGGIQVVLSLMLRVYFIMRYNLRRVIFIDEGLKELSSIYVPKLFDFLNETVSLLGFTYVWVTHDQTFVDYADKVYRVTDGTIKEITKS